MSKTVIVIGAGGFLGQYICRHFAATGWSVVGVDVALQPPPGLSAEIDYRCLQLPHGDTARLLDEIQPDVCIHCAGSASVGLSLSDPRADFMSNTALVADVLEALRRHAPTCRFLLLSSAAVYGNPAALPISEETACAPISPYGFHKRMAELLCEEYASLFGLPTAAVRIFSAYGPGLKRQVIWDICQKILVQRKLPLRGTGRESRDFIHAADIARSLEIIAAQGVCRGEIYNVASGEEITIEEISHHILQALDSTIAPQFDRVTSVGDPLNWRADISRLKALGFTPSIPFAEGIRDFARWAADELK